MGKLAERLNTLEKDSFKILMACLPEGTFSAMGTFTGAADQEVIPGLDTKTVMNMAVNILAYCEEMSSALDRIERIEEKLDKLAEQEKRHTQILVGAVKNFSNEVDTRLDGIEYRMRSEEDLQAMLDRLRKENESDEDSEKEE